MRFAAYRKLTDPSARVADWSWPRLRDWLAQVRPYHGSKEDRKASCPLWSPVDLVVPRRANANVRAVSALVLDYDDDVDPGEALDEWDGFERLVHTTWSHAPMAPRCRVVIPLASPIPADVWSSIYRGVLDEHRLPADRQTLDPARAFYLPASGAEDCAQVFTESGEMMDLSERVEPTRERLRAELAEQQQAIAARVGDVAAEFGEASEAVRELRRLYEVDPDRREAAGVMMGAAIVKAGPLGTWAARDMPCPGCGRGSLWWPLVPKVWTFARCDHRDSCGYEIHLFDYIKEYANGAQ